MLYGLCFGIDLIYLGSASSQARENYTNFQVDLDHYLYISCSNVYHYDQNFERHNSFGQNNESLGQRYDVLKFTESLNASFLRKEKKHVNIILVGHHYRLFYRLMRQAEESMKSGKIDEQLRIWNNQLVSRSANDGSVMMNSKQHPINIQLQQADKQYEISKERLSRFWSLLTRRSVDIDKVEHHIRIASQNARLAQEQYNTLLIADSENPNTVRQY
ncbi:MAG: hypothetical protein EZS28_013603 [Streblomastix strix]|uniref:TmcB/TmcC TPR repeats domain-containing protein n=1 Tax=Streblomastix strix TaxID=222440 RepID=A0A5J4W7J4_9EUKA|nr:MAG: hypothetical protein EZS28_013603 [Streblomastix strix]